MKNLTSPIICILICLVPTFLAGQALQVQNQLPGHKAPLRSLQLNSMQPLTGSPLLRISNIGSSGQDGVSIQLNSQSLTDPGPSILFDVPVPGTAGSGAMRLLPNEGNPFLKVTNIGSSGQDGVKLSFGNPPELNSFFDVFYDLSLGTETHMSGDPDFDLLRITSYDKATPKLLDRVMSTHLDSFFDVFYDLNLAVQGVGFGFDPDDLCLVHKFMLDPPVLQTKIQSSDPLFMNRFFDITYDLEEGSSSETFDSFRLKKTFDPVTPKLLMSVGKNGATNVFDRFDVFYDLSLATTGVGFGFEPDDLCLIHKFENDPPRLLTKIQSSDPLYLNSFFDITYDLDLGTIRTEHENLVHTVQYRESDWDFSSRISSEDPLVPGFFDISYDLTLGQEIHMHGDPDFDLLRITSYDKTTPKLVDRVMSTHLDSFFDVFYDLNLAVQGVGFGFDPDDLCLVNEFHLDPPSLHTKIQSSDPLYLNSFFDITYDLAAKTAKIQMQDFHFTRTFDPATPKLLEHIASSNPIFSDRFFDISYDLNTRTHKIIMEDLIVSTIYDPGAPSFIEEISSANPLYANSFFDITYDIGARAAKVQFEDILITRTYDPTLPRIQERLSDVNSDYTHDIITSLVDRTETHVFGDLASDMKVIRTYDKSTHTLNDRILDSALPPASFFDITYNMSPAGGGGATGKVQFQDFHFTRTFDAATPKLFDHIASSNPLHADKFFDISYDLTARTAKVIFKDLVVTRTFDVATPKLQERISSALLPYIESFFDITYDLSTHIYKTEHEDLVRTELFDGAGSKHHTIFSSNVFFPPQYFEVLTNISNPNLMMQSYLCGTSGTPTLELRYEYDALSRKIREVSTDVGNGATLLLERRLSPAGSSLFVSDKLEVQGALSTPGGGPLAIADNILVTGTTHQINGTLTVNGGLSVIGPKMFKIDHPLDPEHKYLIHSCIESPDMMNIYNGNTITDEQGYVTVSLPAYFEVLNTDYRYQLTCMGQFAQAIIAEKIKDNQFVIRTDKPNVEVSWQVTGIRNDPAANRKSYAVEIEKEPEMKGTLLYAKQ